MKEIGAHKDNGQKQCHGGNVGVAIWHLIKQAAPEIPELQNQKLKAHKHGLSPFDNSAALILKDLRPVALRPTVSGGLPFRGNRHCVWFLSILGVDATTVRSFHLPIMVWGKK